MAEAIIVQFVVLVSFPVVSLDAANVQVGENAGDAEEEEATNAGEDPDDHRAHDLRFRAIVIGRWYAIFAAP